MEQESPQGRNRLARRASGGYAGVRLNPSPAGTPAFMARPQTTAISPFFIVTNVEQTIAFYRDKLGFDVRFRDAESPWTAIVGRDGAQLFVKAEGDISPV